METSLQELLLVFATMCCAFSALILAIAVKALSKARYDLLRAITRIENSAHIGQCPCGLAPGFADRFSVELEKQLTARPKDQATIRMG